MSLKDYINLRESQNDNNQIPEDWRKHFIQLEKGFVPPTNLRVIVKAFLGSSDVPVMKDTSKDIKMSKKPLFLVGGPVRDFLKGKTVKDYDLATPATPEQIAAILNHAGFSMSEERGSKVGGGQELELNFVPKKAKGGDKKVWFVKGRDNSSDKKVFVIGANVNGEEFDIATFRKDAKVTDGSAAVDFVDNPHEDASRRDLTINAMYIELTKPDGENNKLYDPTGKGFHDVKNSVVRTVGNAEDRFQEDKLRVLRAIRFHCRFGKGKMDSDILKGIAKFKNLSGVALERIRDEFLKGLVSPDVDTKNYLEIYSRTGLLSKVLPDIQVRMDIPEHFNDKKDKFLALAWILQDNPPQEVDRVLGKTRNVEDKDVPTGWSNQERNAVLYLLNLKNFDVDNIDEFLDHRQGTALSDDQIRDWVDMFKHKDGYGNLRHSKPQWAKMVHTFVDFKPHANEKITWHEKLPCPGCDGPNCQTCGGSGFLKGGVHPSIIALKQHDVPVQQRSGVVRNLNKSKLKELFTKML